MTTRSFERQVRKRAFLYLTPEVARAGCMDLMELQQFARGTIDLPDDCLRSLARRMSIPLPKAA